VSELDDALETEQLVLSDLINRVLDKGVVITGHVTISIADIDLLELDLRLLLTSVQTALAHGIATGRRSGHGNASLLPPDAAAS
jgi:gas vesicle structural protein